MHLAFYDEQSSTFCLIKVLQKCWSDTRKTSRIGKLFSFSIM